MNNPPLPKATDENDQPSQPALNKISPQQGMLAISDANDSGIKHLWQICVNKLHSEINTKDYHDWIEPLKVGILDNHDVSLSTDKPYIATVVNHRFLKLIVEALSQCGLTLQNKCVTCKDGSVVTVADNSSLASQPDNPVIHGSSSSSQGNDSSAVIDDDLLSYDFKFDKFIRLQSNALAYKTANDIAKNPSKYSHGPVVLYGPVGMGKTHLMHAIGNSLQSKFSHFKVMVFHFNSFLRTYVDAIKQGKMDIFHKSLKAQDVILIDDIHFISNKQGTQEQLFDLINFFVAKGHILVLTCDQHPSHIKKLPERLRSRLTGGILVPIDQPSEDERVQLLEKVCKAKGYRFAPGIAEFVVKRSATNIRELISALDNMIEIHRHSQLQHPLEDQKQTLDEKLLTRKHAVTFLRDNIPYHLRYSVDRIKHVVADYYQLDVETLRSPSRKRKVVVARHIAMELMRTLTQESLSTIGQAFDKDHTSVIHAGKRIKREKSEQTQVAEDFYQLCRTLETGDY